MDKSNSQPKRRTFEFPTDVNEYLAKVPNMTQYLTRLVREDMGKEKTAVKEDVIKIVSEYLGQYNFKDTQSTKDVKDKRDMGVAKSIIDILDI